MLDDVGHDPAGAGGHRLGLRGRVGDQLGQARRLVSQRVAVLRVVHPADAIRAREPPAERLRPPTYPPVA